MRYLAILLLVLTAIFLGLAQAQVEPAPPVSQAPRRLASGLGLRSTFLYLASSGSTNSTAFLGLEYETDLSQAVSLGGDLDVGFLLLGLGAEAKYRFLTGSLGSLYGFGAAHYYLGFGGGGRLSAEVGLGVEYPWLIALGYLTDPTPSDYRILPIRATLEVGYGVLPLSGFERSWTISTSIQWRF